MRVKNLKLVSIFIMFVFISIQTFAQENLEEININDLPEYIIITSQSTKALGGISIFIDTHKSKYEDALNELNSLLQWKKKLGIRNQTDLLNAMSSLGFEYINAYNGSQVQYASDRTAGDDIINELLEGGTGSFRINMVFRKKK